MCGVARYSYDLGLLCSADRCEFDGLEYRSTASLSIALELRKQNNVRMKGYSVYLTSSIAIIKDFPGDLKYEVHTYLRSTAVSKMDSHPTVVPAHVGCAKVDSA